MTSSPSREPTARRRIGWLEVCLALATATLVLQLIPDAMRLWREWPRAGKQTPARATLKGAIKDQPGTHPHPGPLPEGEGEVVQYFLYLPREYSNEAKWPLLLFLHGSGQRGENLEDVLVCGPAKLIGEGKHLAMIVVTPQCPSERTWESGRLLALLDLIEERFAVDPDRVYVSGYSMGGFGAWDLALAAPERFAALVPVAGGGDASEAHRLSKLPIWAFHGANDRTVPLESSRAMIAAIEQAGGGPRLTVYEDRGHDTCQATFSRDDLYEWLTRQHR